MCVCMCSWLRWTRALRGVEFTEFYASSVQSTAAPRKSASWSTCSSPRRTSPSTSHLISSEDTRGGGAGINLTSLSHTHTRTDTRTHTHTHTHSHSHTHTQTHTHTH